jgi:RimJ/RimL family protein N-acetyltransferase
MLCPMVGNPERRRIFSPPDPQLRDDRIRLRPWEPKDEPAVFEACQDPEIRKWVPIPWPYLREHARGFVREAEQGWADATHGTLAIVDASSDRLLGAIGLTPIEHRVSIGYWIVRAERGRGVATDAVRLLARWALLWLEVPRVELYHFVGNDPSGRVAMKAGFRREGVLRLYVQFRGEARDCVMYSLLASDLE